MSYVRVMFNKARFILLSLVASLSLNLYADSSTLVYEQIEIETIDSYQDIVEDVTNHSNDFPEKGSHPMKYILFVLGGLFILYNSLVFIFRPKSKS